jgi:4-amino-4-deoxy-L-arabinose transferase-like glycosyltransferase
MKRIPRIRMRPRILPSTERWLPAMILAVAAALRFWRLGSPALIGDESYYWLWSERLALCYYDNPAGVALMVRLSTLLGGRSEAGIRWLNALLGVGAVLLAYGIAARLLSKPAALLASVLLAVGAPYVLLSRLVYTDTLQLALLLLHVLLLLPFLPPGHSPPSGTPRIGSRADAALRQAQDAASDSGQRPPGRKETRIPTWRFWAAALSTALLLNTKYNAYLYALAMAAFLAIRRPSLLRDRRTWWGAGIATLGLIPAVAWNAAHNWASYRWQFAHLTVGVLNRSTLLGSLWHTVRYLTLPLALVALVGATQVRGARRQVLWVPALALAAPIALSPANSPRNLVTGTMLLLLLGSDAICRWATRPRSSLTQRRSIRASLLLCILAFLLSLWTGIYGLGTVLETLRPTAWPHSPAATTVRQEGLGWRDAANQSWDPEVLHFAVDYNIASQLRYYTGLPVQTAWGQYRLWGYPELVGNGQEDDIVIVALSYIAPSDGAPDLISTRLQTAFRQADGPTPLLLREGNETKQLNVWTAHGRRVDTETFLRMFDLLDLADAVRAQDR